LPVNKSSVSVCGNAVTVRVRAGDNLLIHKALQLLQPGDVLVVDGGGDISRALFGEIMMTVAKSKGAIGAVFDGAIRDVEAFEKYRFPCWARGINLRGPLSPAVALEGARLGKEKEAVELKTIQSVLNGQYDDSWVDIALKKS
jgi:regulator of RNase E activity RraA